MKYWVRSPEMFKANAAISNILQYLSIFFSIFKAGFCWWNIDVRRVTGRFSSSCASALFLPSCQAVIWLQRSATYFWVSKEHATGTGIFSLKAIITSAKLYNFFLSRRYKSKIRLFYHGEGGLTRGERWKSSRCDVSEFLRGDILVRALLLPLLSSVQPTWCWHKQGAPSFFTISPTIRHRSLAHIFPLAF